MAATTQQPFRDDMPIVVQRNLREFGLLRVRVFQRLLLLQKKKYAAVKVEDGTRTSVEVKGLDMKRREYCALSKAVSQYVLEQILSGEDPDTVVLNIHEYLATMSSEVRGGKVKLDDFIIFKVSCILV